MLDSWKLPALPLVTVTLPGTTRPYTPWRRNEMKSGVNVGLLKVPPMKTRWPTSIDEFPNRLFGLNQVLLKKEMSYVATLLTAIVCTVSTRPEAQPPVSATHKVTACAVPGVGLVLRMSPDASATTVVVNW